MWRFLEVHISKLIFLLLILIAAANVRLRPNERRQHAAAMRPLFPSCTSRFNCSLPPVGRGRLRGPPRECLPQSRMRAQHGLPGLTPENVTLQLNFFKDNYLDDQLGKNCTQNDNATGHHFMDWVGLRKGNISEHITVCRVLSNENLGAPRGPLRIGRAVSDHLPSAPEASFPRTCLHGPRLPHIRAEAI